MDSLNPEKTTGSDNTDKFIDLLVEVRTESRAKNMWALSDTIREKLKELRVTIEDRDDSTSWRWG